MSEAIRENAAESGATPGTSWNILETRADLQIFSSSHDRVGFKPILINTHVRSKLSLKPWLEQLGNSTCLPADL
jgi:hypothetical protein